MLIVTSTTTGREKLPEGRNYRWRDPARVSDPEALETLRRALDAEARIFTREPAARTESGARPLLLAAPEPEPVRCRACSYLTSSIGHRVNCGG